MERTYGVDKKFFDFDNYKQLVECVGAAARAGVEFADEDVVDFEKAMNAFVDYVEAVDMTEHQIGMARFRLEGEAYREVVAQCDQRRRNEHEAAIARAKYINRLANAYKVGNLFLGDPEDRYAVADFCLEVVNTIFAHRKK